MTQPVFTERNLVQDFLKWYVDERYISEAGTIQNKTGSALAANSFTVGMPLNLNGSQWETINSGGEAAADGFLLSCEPVPALAINGITPRKYRILVRGPALVNPDAITTDPLGTAYVKADCITRLQALSPRVEVLREPTATETQTK